LTDLQSQQSQASNSLGSNHSQQMKLFGKGEGGTCEGKEIR
jgi:hypothetical protein